MSTLTPNVVVQNPTVRKVAGIVIGVALIVFPTAAVLDSSTPALDFSAWLTPATNVTAFLAGLFGLAVTTPNVPSSTAPLPDDELGDEDSDEVEFDDASLGLVDEPDHAA